MNHGFITPTLSEEHWVLGGALTTPQKKVINPSRDWRPFLPWGELQQRKIETSSCSEYGTLNAIETLERKLFGLSSNYSERFVAIGAGNTEQGNDPHIVAEWIRHNGIVNEVVLPFTNEITSFEIFMTPNPLTDNYLNEAKKWLDVRLFNHEWVFSEKDSLKNKQTKLLEALTYSPVGISVSAWRKEGNIYIKNPDEQDNHWTLLVAGKSGKPWKVFDSYMDDDFIKELDWNYPFGFAKSYSLKEIKVGFLKSYLSCIFQ